jgi:predicted RNA-binding protein with PIN domain
MDYLIDGYNLLHVMGVLRDRLGGKGLANARQRLLALVHGAHKEGSLRVTVVFDAAHPPRGLPAEQNFKGIDVQFAVGRDQADDLIEELIAQAASPKQLTVVSDDHRLQRAAKRRRCLSLGCDAYLRWMDRQYRQPPPNKPDQPSKPTKGSAEENADFLKAFGQLDDDPDFKEIFRRYDFGTE